MKHDVLGIGLVAALIIGGLVGGGAFFGVGAISKSVSRKKNFG